MESQELTEDLGKLNILPNEEVKQDYPILCDKQLYTTLVEIFENPEKLIENEYSEILCKMLTNSTRFKTDCNFVKDEEDGKYYFKGYYDRNCIHQVATIISLWNEEKCFPISFYPLPGFTEEDQTEIMNSNTEKVKEMCDKLSTNDKDLKIFLIELLNALKPRGILTMLGVRKTKGSQDNVAFPNRVKLQEAFNELHTTEEKSKSSKAKKPSILTVGARALCKHGHRGAEGFWGAITGKEAEKNARAEAKAITVMDNCIWINLHILPHDEYILELRTIEGYGLRWTDQAVFRGLLEPPMEGGHEKGWKH